MPELEKGPFAELEGGWILHRAWAGTMGVAIDFKRDGTFDYWFYSDARSEREPKYPITGKWKWNGNVVELEAGQHLYDKRWYACRHRGERALLPDHARQWQLKDGKPHTDRLLFQVPKFDPARPFLTDLPHLERRKSESPTTSPASSTSTTTSSSTKLGPGLRRDVCVRDDDCALYNSVNERVGQPDGQRGCCVDSKLPTAAASRDWVAELDRYCSTMPPGPCPGGNEPPSRGAACQVGRCVVAH